MSRVLPDISDTETVLFHRDLRLPSSWLVLQIPVKGKANKSNTFRIDLEKAEDRSWFNHLPKSRDIKDQLGLYGHVVYFPRQQEVVPVEDKEVQEMTMTQRLFSGAAQSQESPLHSRRAGVKLGIRRTRRPIV